MENRESTIRINQVWKTASHSLQPFLRHCNPLVNFHDRVKKYNHALRFYTTLHLTPAPSNLVRTQSSDIRDINGSKSCYGHALVYQTSEIKLRPYRLSISSLNIENTKKKETYLSLITEIISSFKIFLLETRHGRTFDIPQSAMKNKKSITS